MFSFVSFHKNVKIAFFLFIASFFILTANSFAKLSVQTLPSFDSNDRPNSLVLQQLRNSDSLFLDHKTIGEVENEGSDYTEEVTQQIPLYTDDVNSKNELIRLNALICLKSPDSPLCDDISTLQDLRYISEERGVSFWLMIGITHAESRIGTDFAPGCTPEYYNWGGVKARRLDTGEVIRDYPIPDYNGCWIYKFNSLQDYWISTSNIIKMGYLDKGCSEEDDVARCISECYVGGCGSGEEESWIMAVNHFRPYPLAVTKSSEFDY